MLFWFADYTLDVDRRELLRGSEQVPVEPQVFDLLIHLIQNRDRVVSKDDLISSVWGGRIVSESTLTSRINAARRAVGDNGAEQRFIRTVARKGIRFVAEIRERAVAPEPTATISIASTRAEGLHQGVDDPVEIQPSLTPASPPSRSGGDPYDAGLATPSRASIAVLPFADRSPTPSGGGGIGDGLVHDVITRLAKLRSLFVIAQGTVFALREQAMGPEQALRRLNVEYVASGSVWRSGERLTVSVELSETRTSRIVWRDTFDRGLDSAFLVLNEIGDRIVASIASEIEAYERNRAILKPPDSLDAWEAYHRGLWHMYRFSKTDNDHAQHLFYKALRLDPTFARAYAGLSFTHFQNAFQGWARSEPEIERAYAAASQSLLADDRDPAAHWAMGRALWLRGGHEQSLAELGQAVDLSPNFALAHYNLAFVNSTVGDPLAAISSSDHSRSLSPFDPMLFGMLGARAMALVRLSRFEEAAEWGLRAATRPNSFPHISSIAACSLALAGRLDEARTQLEAIRRARPDYSIEEFLRAMHFAADASQIFRQGAKRIGLV
jgi:TolB-like protein/DNA-binding winged helix-turn-helix (wHTH) protein/tetratricopeptide (TPR) repeat protein